MAIRKTMLIYRNMIEAAKRNSGIIIISLLVNKHFRQGNV